MTLPLLLDIAAIPDVPLLSVDGLGSIITLTLLEIVLGIDNLIFLSILVNKLPREQQTFGRRLGLVLALMTRILLLLTLSWLSGLTAPLFTIMGKVISGHDLVLILGGGFLIFKSTWEIFGGVEEDLPEKKEKKDTGKKTGAFVSIVAQIAIMDVVFSLDSVVTAVGLAKHLPIILIAMFLSMIAMLGFAKFIGEFVENHPSMKLLALSFLIMIGTLLVAEGGGQHLPKGYAYSAMAFSVSVELINIWLRKRSKKAHDEHEAELHAHAQEGHAVSDQDRITELEKLVAQQRQRILELEGSRT